MRKIAFLLMFASCSAAAADFTARVAQGNATMATAEGKAYDASLAPAIQAAMVACVPPGATATGKVGKFTLVAYADASGHLSSIDVMPVTSVSRCFGERFGAATLPPPPSFSGNAAVYPVTVEMVIE